MPPPWTATKLDQISPNEPGDGELVSELGLALKEFRLSSKNSFTTQGEHSGTGRHKIPYGTTGARPAFGKPGRIYINTDFIAQGILILQYDTGSAWQSLEVGVLNTRSFGHQGIPTVFINGNQSVGQANELPFNQEVMVLRFLDYFESGMNYTLFTHVLFFHFLQGGSALGVELKLKLDGVTQTTLTVTPTSVYNSFRLPGGSSVITLVGPAAGWHSIEVTAKQLDSNDLTYVLGGNLKVARVLP